MAATMKPTPSKRKTADGAEPMATDEEMACLIRAQDSNKKISATVRSAFTRRSTCSKWLSVSALLLNWSFANCIRLRRCRQLGA